MINNEIDDELNNQKNEHNVDPDIIKGKFFEISGSMTRIEAEKSLINEIISQIEDATGQEKKIIRKTAKMFHKSERDQVIQETDDVVNFYDKICSTTKK